MMEQKKKRWISLCGILICCFPFLNSCKSKEEIRREQFLVNGRATYMMHCANCHGKNGEGLRALYPSLEKSNKLGDIAYLTCLIKNGSKGTDEPMPANKNLYNIDIAQLITYLNSRWGSDKITEINEVAKVNC